MNLIPREVTVMRRLSVHSPTVKCGFGEQRFSDIVHALRVFGLVEVDRLALTRMGRVWIVEHPE